ncbi:ScbA/BarX family gamma-butyrolactone biosynthesis protein [Streptomyces sp. MMBL 11-3]|uniref:ScbA/BarX family gamma-butyrolactone biosynthesis protein n=1 Tax=Streptomyces sp. MMBL 11-3 TaxID=3382639 RepID=UPI0039B5A26C
MDTFRYARPAGPSVQSVQSERSAQGGTGLSPALSGQGPLTSTVPKELVHRAAVAEVLLTGWERRADARFAVTAQWPRGHSFFTPVGGTHYDPLMVAETIRQVGSLLAHAEFGVPVGHQFLMHDLEIAVQPGQLVVEAVPASLDIEVTYPQVKQRRLQHAGARYEAVVRREGRVVARGSASYTCVSSQVYQRVRAGRLSEGRPAIRLTAPLSPQSVGRMSPTDVVLSPLGEADGWQLRVDTRHPILFDHPVDHIPGMMLLEAARQAATAVLNRSSLTRSSFLPTSLVSRFRRYAELDSPCTVQAHRLPADPGEHRVLVSGHQDGEPLFDVTVSACDLRG